MFMLLLYYTLVHLYGPIKKKKRPVGENAFKTDVRFP